MSLIPFPFSFNDTPFSPPDDDTELHQLFAEKFKQASKQYRELLEAFLRDLESQGNIQCFAFTLNVHFQGKAPPSTALQVAGVGCPSIEGCSFQHHVGTILQRLSNIDLLECIFITQEFHKEGELKGLPHYHVFMAIRSLFGTGGIYIQASLQDHLIRSFPDFQLRRLNTFLDQKKYLNYMVKEEKRYYHALYAFSSNSNPPGRGGYFNRFYHYSFPIQFPPFGALKIYTQMPTSGTFSKTEFNKYGEPLYLPYDHERANPDSLKLHTRHRDVNPFPGDTVTVETFLYCLHLYCHFNKYFLCQDSLYRRRQGSRFSYELVFSLEDLLQDLTPVYSFLAVEFPFQFSYARNFVAQAFMKLIPDVIARFRKNSTGLLPTIQLNYHLVEFRNGIYHKRLGQFLHFEHYPPGSLDGFDFNCYLYFNRYFDSYTRMIPHRWLKLLRPQFQSDQELDDFCARFAVLFHGDSIQQKVLELDKGDKALYVEGVSNSGKTRLLADVVRAIVGPENVGLLGSSENFPLETATAKQTLVLDEYRYRPSQRDILLRMLDGTPLPLDRKHQAQKIVSLIAPVLILANVDRNQAMLTDEAFRNRLRYYRFDLVVSERDISPLEAVQEELPAILLYCNQRFLRRYGSQFRELRNLRYWTRSSRKPLRDRLLAQGFLLEPPPE